MWYVLLLVIMSRIFWRVPLGPFWPFIGVLSHIFVHKVARIECSPKRWQEI
jgi:hypothetical protein